MRLAAFVLLALLLAGCGRPEPPVPDVADPAPPAPAAKEIGVFETGRLASPNSCVAVACVVEPSDGMIFDAGLLANQTLTGFTLELHWADPVGTDLEVHAELVCRVGNDACPHGVLASAEGAMPLRLNGTAVSPAGATVELWAYQTQFNSTQAVDGTGEWIRAEGALHVLQSSDSGRTPITTVGAAKP